MSTLTDEREESPDPRILEDPSLGQITTEYDEILHAIGGAGPHRRAYYHDPRSWGHEYQAQMAVARMEQAVTSRLGMLRRGPARANATATVSQRTR
jgi:hypothetical protein